MKSPEARPWVLAIVLAGVLACGPAQSDLEPEEQTSRFGRFIPPSEVLPGAERFHPTEPILRSRAKGAFHFQFKGPVEFLQFLAKQRAFRFVVEDRHYGWIHDADIPELMKLIESREPCAFPTIQGGNTPEEFSTIGKESLFLIQGYRDGAYPPDIYSDYCDLTVPKAKEWYAKWQQKQSRKK